MEVSSTFTHLRTQKHYSSRPFESCVHQQRLGKAESYFQGNWRNELCSREVLNTKWRSFKPTNLTVSAVLLKDETMGCKDAALRELLMGNGTVNYLTFEENTGQTFNNILCLFRALAHHLQGTERLEEETSKIFNLFINKLDGISANLFQWVHLNDISNLEILLTLNFLLYDIDFEERNNVGDIGIWSSERQEFTLRLLRYKKYICYVGNLNAVFQYFRVTIYDSFVNRTVLLSQKLSMCSEQVKTSCPRNVYQNCLWNAGLFWY